MTPTVPDGPDTELTAASPVERLIDRWTRRAARLDGYGLVIEASQAKAIGQCIRDLRSALRAAPGDDTAAPDPLADVLRDARAVVRHLAEARRTGEDGDWARLARVIDTLGATLDAAGQPVRDGQGRGSE